MDVILYDRQSTRKQLDNFSQRERLDLIRAFCAEQDYTIIRELIDVETGVTIQRKNLEELRKMVRTRAVQAVVFFSSDRFARDVEGSQIIRDEIFKYGLRMFYAWGGREVRDTPEDNLMENVSAASNRYWWDKIQEIATRTRKRKLSEGIPPGTGAVPYGYTLAQEDGLPLRIVVVPELSQVVSLVFHWYVEEDLAVSEIVKRLNEEKPPTPGQITHAARRKTPDNVWGVDPIYRILKNEAYIGRFWHNRFKLIHDEQGRKKQVERDRSEWVLLTCPPVIDEALFLKAQEKLSEGRAKARRNQKYEYLFGRVLVCETCRQEGKNKGDGYAMRHMSTTKANDRKTHYYACGSYYGKEGRCANAGTYFRADLIDDCGWREIETRLLRNPESLRDWLAEYQAEQLRRNEPLYSEIAIIDERLSRNQTAILNLVTALEQGTVENGSFVELVTARYKELEESNKRLTDRRNVLSEQLEDVTLDDETISLLTTFGQLWQEGKIEATFENKRRAIEKLRIQGRLAIEEGKQILYLDWCYKTFKVALSADLRATIC